MLYLQRDRIAFAIGAFEALVGVLGMYLSYQFLGTATVTMRLLV